MGNPFPELLDDADHSHLSSGIGPFNELRPHGITIHYTADRDLDRVVKALKMVGLGYHLIIDRSGTVFQTAKLTERLYHAGKAVWLGRSPNRSHIAISLLSWGLVKEKGPYFDAWNGAEVDPWDVAKRNGHYWDVATRPQEAALMQVLTKLVILGIDPDEICGHDECCIPRGRKVDPGGVLSVEVKTLRNQLKSAQPYLAKV